MKRACLIVMLGRLGAIGVAAEPPKVAADKRPAPAAVAPAVSKLLDPQSYSVTAADKEIGHFWVRGAIPAKAAKGQISYARIPEGTLIGVLEIKSADLTDFRKQALKPGIFTMRLGIQPSDGNHMGVAPSPEFICLSPAETDKSDAAMSHDELMKLSKKAAGTGHPTVMYLHPNVEKPKLALPAVTVNRDGHTVVNLPAVALPDDKKTEFPLSIVIIGTTTAE